MFRHPCRNLQDAGGSSFAGEQLRFAGFRSIGYPEPITGVRSPRECRMHLHPSGRLQTALRRAPIRNGQVEMVWPLRTASGQMSVPSLRRRCAGLARRLAIAIAWPVTCQDSSGGVPRPSRAVVIASLPRPAGPSKGHILYVQACVTLDVRHRGSRRNGHRRREPRTGICSRASAASGFRSTRFKALRTTDFGTGSSSTLAVPFICPEQIGCRFLSTTPWPSARAAATVPLPSHGLVPRRLPTAIWREIGESDS